MTKRLPALLLAFASLLPGLRAALPDRTYFFRDFTFTYWPLRAFWLAELRAGRWPFWNPYAYEGSAVLPMLYPLELAQLVAPGPALVSWLLTLHFPIAALGMYFLARALGASRLGAFASGAAYAMGGLALSSLPLHWFLQAFALVPWLAVALERAARRGGRALVVAAALVALSISTLAVEFVAQGVLLGVGLGLVTDAGRDRVRRLAAALGLGLGLASLPIALVAGLAAQSLRGAGLGPERLVERPLPVAGLLQMLVPDLFGSISEPLRFWWGGRFFAGGPYFMTVYLGPVAIVLAAWGLAALPLRQRRVLLLLGALGLWYALGQAFGLAAVVAPLLHFFRYPVKAMLLPYAVLALGCGFGIDRLASGRGGRGLALCAGLVAIPCALVAIAGAMRPAGLVDWLDISPAAAGLMAATLRPEGAQATALSALVALLGLAVARGLVPAMRAALLLVFVLVGDLARAGSGVNPQVAPGFFSTLPEVSAALRDPGRGRVFSLGADRSPALAAWAAKRPVGVDQTSYWLSRQLEGPFSNLADGLEGAEGPDRLSFVPNAPLLQAAEYAPGNIGALLPRLRALSVSRITSLDPLESAGLALLARVPAGPLLIHVYAVRDPWPRAFVACRVARAPSREAAERSAVAGGAVEAVVETGVSASCGAGDVKEWSGRPGADSYAVSLDGPGLLVVRDSFTPSWRATIDGRPAEVVRVNGRHRGVPLPAGSHSVTLRYDPPGLGVGLAGTLIAATVAALALWRAARESA